MTSIKHAHHPSPYNGESKIVKILKKGLTNSYKSHIILNIGEGNFRKFEMGEAGVMFVGKTQRYASSYHLHYYMLTIYSRKIREKSEQK